MRQKYSKLLVYAITLLAVALTLLFAFTRSV